MIIDSINSEQANLDKTTLDSGFAMAIEEALDTLVGSRTRIAIMRFLAIKNDFFYEVNTESDSNPHSPVNELTKEEIEKKLRIVLGIKGAACVLDRVNRNLGVVARL